MSVIRWEQVSGFKDTPLDIWEGWLGRYWICTVKQLKEAQWHVRLYPEFPGSCGESTDVADSFEEARKLAEETLQDWLDQYGLEPKRALSTITAETVMLTN
ncbi:hypothetical protein OS035_24430 [Rhizobium sp. 268]|uniref:hypothetical protein n=1 Tax=Rhizobium sp. 268 TaxID=2996375 RepID=UPI002F93B386